MNFIKKTISPFIYFLGFGINAMLSAAPNNPTAVSGVIYYSNSDGQALVQCIADRSIVEWDDFSIDETESVFFQLPTIDSAVLNRVTGNLPSNVMGNMSSNGIVYFINDEGILIGSTANVQANTFLVSSIDAINQEFLSGTDMTFTATTQNSVDNQGIISVLNGDVVVLGPQVSNEGQIFAQQGQVSMGAGQVIILHPLDQDSITILVP
jgi:filamentous hemagglutinin family protein